MDGPLKQFLLLKSVKEHHIHILEENEVDSAAFSLLLEKDFFDMFAGKVGVARKLMAIQESWIRLNIGPSDTESFEVSGSTMPVSSSNAESDMTNEEESLTEDFVPELRREDAMFPKSTSICEEFASATNFAWISNQPRSIPPEDIAVGDQLEHDDLESRTSHDEYSQETESSSPHVPGRKKIMPLPKFSPNIESALRNGDSDSTYCLHDVIHECAHHILRHGDMSTNDQYAAFCSRLCKTYPCLKYPGKHDYSYFSHKLSQRIRTIRHGRKRDSSSVNTGVLDASTSTFTEEEADEILQSELKKTKCNWPKIIVLFNRVHFRRRRLLSEIKSKSVCCILKTIPTLSDIRLIREEFKMMTTVTFTSMKENYIEMLRTFDKMTQSNSNEEGDEVDEVNCLLLLQAKLKDNRIKVKSQVDALSLSQAHNLNLSSKKMEPPHLIFARHESGSHQGWVVADGKIIKCLGEDGVFGMVLDLLGCYYALDLAYPKDFQILGFLQQIVVKDSKNPFYKSAKFVDFEKRFLDFCFN